MNKKIMCYIIIGIFIGASILPSISGNNKILDNQTIINKTISSTETDWWPMFHHDSENTGFSTSSAPSSNNIKWSFQGSDITTPTIVDNKVYVSAYKIYCLDPDYGNILWEFEDEYEGEYITSSPTISDDRLFVLTHNFSDGGNSHLLCLNKQNGNKLWSYEIDNNIWAGTSPIIDNDKIYFYAYRSMISHGYGILYCVDIENGQEIWKYTTDEKSDPQHSPAVYNNKVYFGCRSYVYCIDGENGQKIWSHEIDNAAQASPSIFNDKLYVGDMDNNFYCLDVNTGDEIWKYEISNVGYIRSCSAIAYGKVFFGSTDSYVYCLDAETGLELWNYKTEFGIYSSPAVADGKVFIGCGCPNLAGIGIFYCIDAENGQKIWEYEVTICYCNCFYSPSIALGNVFVCSCESLYCFGNSSFLPPDIPTISGPTSGRPYTEYTYTFFTNDPNKYDVYYSVDWGYGYGFLWEGPFESGTEAKLSFTWIAEGDYEVRVKAKNIYGAESEWSDPLIVSMPKNKVINPLFLQFLQNFLENHPHMFPLLRQLLRL